MCVYYIKDTDCKIYLIQSDTKISISVQYEYQISASVARVQLTK